MHLPRRLRETADLEDVDEDDSEDAETFRDLLLEALASDPAVQAAVRRLAAAPKAPEPRASRRR